MDFEKPKFEPKEEWLEEGIKSIKEGGTPTIISNKLEQYLIGKGIPEERIRKMKPEEAWQEAAKIYQGPAKAEEAELKTATEKLEKETKENRFIERLSILKINPQEIKEEEMEKLKSINEAIEKADAPWVVRVMDEIKRKGGEEYLLKSFGPEDVNTLQKIAQEKGYDLSGAGIVTGQAKEIAEAFKQKEGEMWAETFYKKGGKIGQAKIEKIEEELRREKEVQTKAVEEKIEVPEAKLSPEAQKAQVAEEKREETHEEISRRLLEHPAKALEIFKKGVGLKLEKACIGFAHFWEKTGAKALKGLSWTGEKAVGYPAGELNRAVWTVGEFFEARPGIKRLDNTLKIHAHLERLQKGELTPEQVEQLQKLSELHVHAARGQWREIEAFNRWHERKKNTLEAFRTFNKAREKLSGWIAKKKEEAETKKEQAAKKRAKEIAEKLKS